jgi:hypothetical protein
LKKRRKRQILTVIIIIALVLVGTYSYLRWGRGNEVNSIVVLPPRETQERDGIEIEAEIVPAADTELEGSASLKIRYEGETQYSGSLKIASNSVSTTVNYNQFVVGNGDYTVKVSFGGKEGTEIYSLDFVTEDMDVFIDFNETYDAQTQTWIKTGRTVVDVEAGTAEMDVSIRCLNRERGTTRDTPRDLSLEIEYSVDGASGEYREDVEGTFTDELGNPIWDFVFILPYIGWGWNTINITITNWLVKEDSPYREVTQEVEQLIDAYPIAIADDNIQDTISTRTGSTLIDLDGTASRDDHEIIMYQWIFDGSTGEVEEYSESIFDQYDGEDNDGDGEIDEDLEAADGTFDGHTTIEFWLGTTVVEFKVMDDFNPEEKVIEIGDNYIGHLSDSDNFEVEVPLRILR